MSLPDLGIGQLFLQLVLVADLPILEAANSTSIPLVSLFTRFGPIRAPLFLKHSKSEEKNTLMLIGAA